jgi:DNA polymerase III epsilon subunit-like protein
MSEEIERMKKRGILLVLDIETTNFFNKGGKIVEIGIASLNLKTFDMLLIFNEVVKEEGFNIADSQYPNGWIFENSTLTFEECLKAPALGYHIFLLNALFKQYPVTAFNKQFDFQFLRDRDIKIPYECPDPMICSTDYFKLPPTQKMVYAGHGDSYKWPSVQEAWDKLMVSSVKEPHRGGKDCLMEAKIISKLYQKGIFKFDISKRKT